MLNGLPKLSFNKGQVVNIVSHKCNQMQIAGISILTPTAYTKFSTCFVSGKYIITCMNKLFGHTLILRQQLSSMAPESLGPVAKSIYDKLFDQTNPDHLIVLNESNMHNVPEGSETHFKVVVVSKKFEGLTLIKRHRLVNDILQDELIQGVHALSIMAKTPSQWQESDKNVSPSPTCRGGFGK